MTRSVFEAARRDAGAGAWTKVVVNPGSVGQPLDGGPRASYAVIESGVPEIRLVKDEIEVTTTGIRERDLTDDAAVCLIAILKTGGRLPAPT